MKKIIVVDDEVNIRNILIDLLSKAGYETISCKDGFEVLKTVTTMTPDLIISDIMMPKLDGLSLCQALKNSEHSRNIPVILLTASNKTDDFAKGVNLGVKYYCNKPLDVKDILQKVSAVLK